VQRARPAEPLPRSPQQAGIAALARLSGYAEATAPQPLASPVAEQTVAWSPPAELAESTVAWSPPADVDRADFGPAQPYEAEPYEAEPYEAEPYEAEPYEAGPYDTGPYDTGQFRAWAPPQRRPVLAWTSLLLPAILVIQGALSLRLVWSNSAYQDEALYLWAGRLEIAHWTHGAALPAFQTYFSGSPAIYPPLGSLADGVGGLAGARILSLLFMLGATCLLYWTAGRLLDRASAVAAAALFATFGLGVELGAFATYDAMAVFLIALAGYLAVRAGQDGREGLLVLAGLALALADATKYAATLWDPIVICLAVLAAAPGWRARALRVTRIACYTAVPVAAGLLIGGADYDRGIALTTLHRQVAAGTAPLRILDIAWGWMALLLLLGILGVVLIWNDRGRLEVVPVVLFTAAIMAPVVQAHSHDITSLREQVVFGAWFLCAVAGYAVARIAFLDGHLSQGVAISVVLVAVSAGTGYSQASDIFASWPSVAPAMPPLQQSIQARHCPCLITSLSAAEYYLPPADMTGPITGAYTFSYQTAATHGAITGQAAMAAAIRNGYFGAVQIDGLRSAGMYRLLERSLRKSRQYRLVYTRGWADRQAEPTQVWQRIASAR
jgi:hypothetical protein